MLTINLRRGLLKTLKAGEGKYVFNFNCFTYCLQHFQKLFKDCYTEQLLNSADVSCRKHYLVVVTDLPPCGTVPTLYSAESTLWPRLSGRLISTHAQKSVAVMTEMYAATLFHLTSAPDKTIFRAVSCKFPVRKGKSVVLCSARDLIL